MMGIYKIINTETNKYYIGSSQNIFKRWEQHVNELNYKHHHSYKLQHDWDLYGFENFTFNIVQVVNNKKDLLKTEQEWLDHEEIENTYNVIDSTSYKSITVPNDFEENINFCYGIDSDTKNKLKDNLLVFEKKGIFLKLGNNDYDLSKTWYSKNYKLHKQIKNNMINYFTNVMNAKTNEIAWTTFTQYFNKIKGKGNMKSFIPINGEIEQGKKRNVLIFASNCFPNSFIKHKYENKINDDDYSLSIILKWILSVSDINKPINIYVPSKRMETLLRNWLYI